MIVVAGYYRNPLDPPEITTFVVVQSHLFKVGQNDLFKYEPSGRAVFFCFLTDFYLTAKYLKNRPIIKKIKFLGR